MVKGIQESCKQGMEEVNEINAHYWHLLPDGRIQCDLCPRHCRLHEGQSGFCFIRTRIDGQLKLISFNKSSGLSIDPIEKKPLYHFLPGSSILSFGTIGCNLGCRFCQNWDISFSKNAALLRQPANPKIIAQTALEKGCRSVAFTYNEPIISIEQVIDTAKECQQHGIKTVAVTNGYINDEPRKDFFRFMDAANVDLKFFNEAAYLKISQAHLQPVLDTLVYLKKHTSVWLEITILLIPGINDSSEEIDQETQWLFKELGPDVPLHFSAFFPAWKMQDRPPTPLETLIRARKIALKNGLRYVYIGNAHDFDGSTTFCHHCHRKIIERTDYVVTNYQLTDEGRCHHCGTACAGIFNHSYLKEQ